MVNSVTELSEEVSPDLLPGRAFSARLRISSFESF